MDVRGIMAEMGTSVLAQDAEQGALPTLYAATQDIPGNTFVGPNGLAHWRGYPVVLKPSKSSQDPALAARLWTRSAELTGVDMPVPSSGLTGQSGHNPLGLEVASEALNGGDDDDFDRGAV